MDFHQALPRTPGDRAGALRSTLVMGFRNLSILAATGGNIDVSKSSDLGFITAVRDVLKMVDGYPESELASAMSEYRISGDEKALERILLATPAKERKQELTALKKRSTWR